MGVISNKRSFTIINANDKFASHSEILDKFIKDYIKNFDVKILYNSKLKSIDKNT